LLALPCWVLFEIGIFFAGFIEAREKTEEAD
jgi:Sec-independent protein secretion pathway component TatC